MELIKYILLGFLQGITEPLPISSSGHIYVFKALFNTQMFDDLVLEIFLNFASFVAILFIFRNDIKDLVIGCIDYIKNKTKKSKKHFDYLMMIVIGTLPVACVGLFVKDYMETLLTRNIFIVGIGFLITGLALLLVLNSKGKKTDKDITWKDALFVGVFQAVSLLPGISRSGMTLVASLLIGLDKKSAVKYSFMLYFPVSIATMLVGIGDFSLIGRDISTLIYYLISMVSAGIFTYISYNWLTRLVEREKLWRFSLYLFAIAMFTLMFFI